jgi:hypothetical protein
MAMSRVMSWACAVGLVLASSAVGSALVQFDAATAGAGVDPTGVTPAWTRYGTPMTNNGTFLLQDNTADDPGTSSGEYLSPSAGSGLMKLASGQYGIEVKVRPLGDVPFLGGSHYGNAYVFWSDDSYAYNITIDKYTNDVSGTGGIKYGQNSLSDAVTGIDWSVPHTIFVGWTGFAPYGSFNFYVDGVLASTVSAGSMARSGGFPFAQDRVDFGDGTTGQGMDVAIEWYSVRIYDTNVPVPEPTSLLLLVPGLAILRRRPA